MAPKELKTVTDALRREAHMWHETSETLGGVVHTVEHLRLTRIEAGVFQFIFDAYDDVVDFVENRCTEGHRRTSEIATALIKNANAYDAHEADTTKSIEGTY